ncbi:MAG: hypothetical protein Q9170_001758 [Blastenia crenularia]
MSNHGRYPKSNGVQEDTVVDLKPDTISLLTSRIEANLKNSHNGKSLPKTKKTLGTGNKDQIQKKAAKLPKLSKQIHLQEPASTNQQGDGDRDTSSKPRGKKRLGDGKVKNITPPNSNSNGVGEVEQSSNQTSVGQRRLEQEIMALGGSKDDLKLIEDGESESEIEGGASVGKPAAKGLKKELLNLVQELGIEKVSQEVDEESASDDDTSGSATQGTGDSGTQISRKDPAASQPKMSAKIGSQYQVEPTSDWHAVVLPTLTSLDARAVALPPDLTYRVHEYAKTLLNNENEIYASQTGSADSAQQFYSTIMSSGTLSDKISALTLSVQESPLHNVRSLENLVGFARKRSRGQAVEVLGALKDLFGLGSLLPPNRKLRAFAAQPDLSTAFISNMRWTADDPLPRSLQKAHLILWSFEDWLKTMYFDVLKILETWCNDEVVFARGKAVDYVCQLLKEKPEQEANLLRLLVNKLGDNDKKVASKTSYHILQLETAHPLMKPTVISAIESDLLFRPGQSLHAQYYAVITLNQTVLSGKEEAVAKNLLDIYFGLFAKLLAKPQAVTPEVKEIKLNQKGEVQGGGGPAGKAARRKAVMKEKATTVEDDLREKMLSAVLTGVNRAVPYANTNDEVFEKHMDTLFRITHSSNFNTSIQALMLIQQLTGTHQGSADRFYRTLYESLLDPRLLISSKQALYLNLLFKSLRSNLNIKRVKAFTKRLLQVVSMHQPAFACGSIYLLRELEGTFANLGSFADEREEDDSDEEESFHDVHDVEPGQAPFSYTNGSAVQRPRKQIYDPRKRDPEHSNADKSSLWEILPFLTHYHPSVSLFASRLLTHTPMPPKPDLSSHTLIHFLDRFVYRNPKATTPARGASIMQPLPSSILANKDSTNIQLLSSAPSFPNRVKQPVNSESFWKQEAGDVAADEVFFHKYFSTIGKGREKAKGRKERKKGGKEGSEEDDEEEEEEIWKALVESRPEVEGEEGSDFDDVEMDEGIEDSESEGGEEKGADVGSDDEAMPDFDEDDDAILASDEDVPRDLEAAFRKEVQGGDVRDEGEGAKGDKRGKRMKLKHLPVFAEADEYAEMMEGEEDG